MSRPTWQELYLLLEALKTSNRKLAAKLERGAMHHAPSDGCDACLTVEEIARELRSEKEGE